MRRARSRGLTLVEILITLLLVAVACAFIFAIQIRVSGTMRDQATISEVQQTLRSASALIVRDLRMAGYLAQAVGRNGAAVTLGPVTVANGGGGPDVLTVLYADPSALAHIAPGPGNASDTFATALPGTLVDRTAGFAPGDLVLATHLTASGAGPAGVGCLLAVTAVSPPDRIFTDPGAGGPWNGPGNAQCQTPTRALASGPAPLALAAVWNDGGTALSHVVYRTYRVKPGDARGVLQLSPSGGVVPGDWQDLALGIVDLQVALRVFVPDDAVDEDGDGDPERDWHSAASMETAPLLPGAHVVEVSVTLLAKSTREVSTAPLAQTPDLAGAGSLVYNRAGDARGTPLPVTDPSSPYFGDHVYRTSTTTVELRNAGATN